MSSVLVPLGSFAARTSPSLAPSSNNNLLVALSLATFPGTSHLPMPTPLSPTQQQTFDSFLASWPLGNIFSLASDTGMGKSTLLRTAHERLGGALLGVRDLVAAMPARHPLALEEAFDQLLRTALTHHQHVFVDDLHLLTGI